MFLCRKDYFGSIDEEDYFCVFVFQRKKDNPQLRKSTVCVFQDLVKLKYVKEKLPLYQTIAKEHNARVYISASPRDIRRARKDLVIRLIQTEDMNDEPTNIQAQLFSSLMRFPLKDKRRFVIDVDRTDFEYAVSVSSHILPTITYCVVGTRAGWHLITEPFDVRKVDGMSDVEVKKDGMTDISYVDLW